MRIVKSYAYLEKLDKSNFETNKKYIKKFRSSRFPYGETFIKNEIKSYINKSTRYVTYLVKNNTSNDILAYYTLSASAIFWEPNGNIKKNPAIEINYFSLDDKFAFNENGKGIGLGALIFEDFIRPTIELISQYLGISIVILFAIPSKNNKVINAYEKMGFSLVNDVDVEQYIIDKQVKGCRLMLMTL